MAPVLTRIYIGLNSSFLANKINRYFLLHFLVNVDLRPISNLDATRVVTQFPITRNS